MSGPMIMTRARSSGYLLGQVGIRIASPRAIADDPPLADRILWQGKLVSLPLLVTILGFLIEACAATA